MPEPQIPGCKQCGKCCRFDWGHAMIKTGDLEADKLARFQGATDLGYALVWDHPCRYLMENNLCRIHDSKERPQCCKDYGPGNKMFHPDGCAFVSTDHDSRDWKMRTSGKWKGQDEEE